MVRPPTGAEFSSASNNPPFTMSLSPISRIEYFMEGAQTYLSSSSKLRFIAKSK
ncbi:MAG TPA: hypothetical protein VH500_13460 [Nitrososphaeraceae archaeon]